MQGQRSAVDSLPETLSFDNGSTSSNAGLDQEICLNNMRNHAHNRLSDYVIPPSDPSITFLNSTSQQNLSGWNLGEPSSSGPQNQVSYSEQKTERGWSSSMSAYAGPGPNLGYESSNVLSLNNINASLNSNQIANGPLFVQSSSSNAILQDLNINPEFLEHSVDDDQVTESPNIYNGRISSTSSSSAPFVTPSGSGGYFVEENHDRPGGSLEGRRIACKRKALEGHVGQSSISESSSYFQHAETSAWHAVPARYNACSNLTISPPPENHLGFCPPQPVNPRLGLGVGGVPSQTPLASNVAGSSENSRRNFRVRLNPSGPSHQETPVTNNVFPTGSVVGNSSFSGHPHHSPRLLPLNNSLELRSARTSGNTNPQRQSVLTHVPPHEESNSTSMPLNISERSMFVPTTESRTSVQNPTTWGLNGGNTSIAGFVTPVSRPSSSSGVRPPSAHNLVPHRNPTRYPRRLSEFVRRSLMASAGSESGGQSSNNSPLHAGSSTSSHEMALSRSAMLSERQPDGAFGTPYTLRTLAAASEGRSRLVSEIRSVLDLMRRGEGLRFEDVMILDQSVIFGMADLHDRHDRHRDMRLDVDNMSYEELLALEDRIGYVSTGLSEETITNRLKQRKHLPIALGAQQEIEPCCICQEEYSDGEDLGILECGHDFHSECVKQWLTHKNLCPICKTTALVT